MCTQKEILRDNILTGMQPFLNAPLMEILNQVVVQALFGIEVTESETLPATIDDTAKYHLRKYIDSRNDKEPALFISSKRDCKRLAKPGIESAIGRIAERSGLKRRVYPHLFRKTTATNMVKRGCPRELVAFYLGHKNGDARTLNKHYAATTPDQVLGAFRKYGAAA